MIPHTNNGQEYLMVEVPAVAYDFRVRNPRPANNPSLDYNVKGQPDAVYVTLPPGQWQILFLAKDATPEQAEGLVEKIIKPNEPTYYKGYGDVDYVATTNVMKSFESLLTSHGMGANCLVLRKIK